MSAVIIDIYSKGEYPANVLSNFFANSFIFDGVECGSMEGFLQSLKFRNERKQKKVCEKSGSMAKAAGKRKFLWKFTGNVFWKGVKIKRESQTFDLLINRAYEALYIQSPSFRTALLATKGKKLTHSLGKKDKSKTILTEKEFIDCLIKLLYYREKNFNNA